MLLHERTRKRAIRLALVLGVWGPTLLVAAVCWRSSQPAALRSAVAQVEAATNLTVQAEGVEFPRPRVVRLLGFQIGDAGSARPLASATSLELVDHGDYVEVRCDELNVDAGQLRVAHDLWRQALQRLRVERRRRAVQLVAERVVLRQEEEPWQNLAAVRAALSPLRDDWQAWADFELTGSQRRGGVRWAATAEDEEQARLRLDTGGGILPGALAELISPPAGAALANAEICGALELVYSGGRIDEAALPAGQGIAVRFENSPLPAMEGDLVLRLAGLRLDGGRLRELDAIVTGGPGRWSVAQLRHAARRLGLSLDPELAATEEESPLGLGVDYERMSLRLALRNDRLQVFGDSNLGDSVLTDVAGRVLAFSSGTVIPAANWAEAIAPRDAPWTPRDAASVWLASMLPKSTSRLAVATDR